jgi:hypothetical protein
MQKKKLLWGTFTWILFHWITENIKEEHYLDEREKLIFIIKRICNYLPCPDCRSHAAEYLKQYEINNNSKTRDDLSNYMHFFHNFVNIRTKKNFESKDILLKYKTADINKILLGWNFHFNDTKGMNLNDFMAKIRIQELKNEVNKYFHENMYKFTNS